MLYGYGSYGISIDPTFSSRLFSYVDRGIVYCIAHVRGGGENGRGWYETGKFQQKKHTFEDFVTAAEFLVKKNVTQHSLLAMEGGTCFQ